MRRRVAVTGAAGQLGREVVAAFSEAGDDVLALTRADFDITSTADIHRLVDWQPDVVVNSAAWTDVDGCARDPDRAMLINGAGAGSAAEAAARARALVVQVSTNEVFDGTLNRPYTEDDEPSPVNPYGASKLLGEQLVAAANPRHIIARTAWLFGRGGTNFPAKIRAAADRARASGEPLRVVDDEWGNPTNVTWLSSALEQLVDLVTAGRASPGVYHLAGTPATTRIAWARAILRDTDVSIEPVHLADYRRESRVPPRAVLDTARAQAIGISAGYWHAPAPQNEVAAAPSEKDQ